MARAITQTIYEKEDYEKVKDMPISEVINTLYRIERGWISDSNYHGQDDFEGDEDDYDRYKQHQALRIAIKHLAQEK